MQEKVAQKSHNAHIILIYDLKTMLEIINFCK